MVTTDMGSCAALYNVQFYDMHLLRSSSKQVTIVFLALKTKIFNHFRVDIRR